MPATFVLRPSSVDLVQAGFRITLVARSLQLRSQENGYCPCKRIPIAQRLPQKFWSGRSDRGCFHSRGLPAILRRLTGPSEQYTLDDRISLTSFAPESVPSPSIAQDLSLPCNMPLLPSDPSPVHTWQDIHVEWGKTLSSPNHWIP